MSGNLPDKKKLKAIEQMINGIDEKYTDSAAERLYSKRGEIRELTEIIIEPSEPKKHGRLKKFLSLALPTAAMTALMIGAVKFITLLPEISSIPAQTDVTRPAPADAVSGSDTPDNELMGDVITRRDFAFLNDYYVVLESAGENGEITLYTYDYNVDVSEAASSSGKALTVYETGMRSAEIMNNSCELQGQTLADGDILALSVPTEQDGKVYYNIYLYVTAAHSITPLTPADKNAEYMNELFADAYFRTVPETDIIRIKGTDGNLNNYLIVFPESKIYKTGINELLDNDGTKISLSQTFGDKGIDLALYESLFYGKWCSWYDSASGIDLTYYGHHNYEWAKRYIGAIAETEYGWFMEGINGGMPLVLYIPRSDTNELLLYDNYISYDETADDYFITLSNYEMAYSRMPSDAYDGTIRPGELSTAGIIKLSELSGCDMTLLSPNSVTDGETWSSYPDTRFTLSEYSGDRIVYNKRFIPSGFDETVVYENEDETFSRNFRITVEKNASGEWELTEAHEYDPDIEIPDGYKLQSTDYFPISGGNYYAVCKLESTANNVLTRYLYYNGHEYIVIADSEGDDIAEPVVLDDKLFFIARDDTYGDPVLFAANGGNKAYSKNIIVGSSVIIDAKKVGELYCVELSFKREDGTKGKNAALSSLFSLSPFYCYAIDSDYVTLNDDGTLAVGIIDGISPVELDYNYNCSSNDINDMIWYLDNESSYIWFYMELADKLHINPEPYYTDVVYSDSLEPYYYLCEYNEMFVHLRKVFDFKTARDIIYKYFFVFDNKLYCNRGPRGGGIRNVTFGLRNVTEDSAEIVYLVLDDSGDTEYSYTVNAVRNEEGWRLDKLFRPEWQ